MENQNQNVITSLPENINIHEVVDNGELTNFTSLPKDLTIRGEVDFNKRGLLDNGVF